MPPQVGDEMPWRRKQGIAMIFAERDRAQQEQADEQEREADRAKVAAEHAERLRRMGLDPDGQPLGG